MIGIDRIVKGVKFYEFPKKIVVNNAVNLEFTGKYTIRDFSCVSE